MPHTPRLCIDSRTAVELPQTGIMTQELIDQLQDVDDKSAEVFIWVDANRIPVSHADDLGEIVDITAVE